MLYIFIHTYILHSVIFILPPSEHWTQPAENKMKRMKKTAASFINPFENEPELLVNGGYPGGKAEKRVAEEYSQIAGQLSQERDYWAYQLLFDAQLAISPKSSSLSDSRHKFLQQFPHFITF